MFLDICIIIIIKIFLFFYIIIIIIKIFLFFNSVILIIWNILETTNTVLFDINHSEHHFPKFIRKNNLSTIIKKTNKPIMEDNKVVIGVYVRIYYENN